MKKIFFACAIFVLMTGNSLARMDEPATSTGSKVGGGEGGIIPPPGIATTGSEFNCNVKGEIKVIGTEDECRVLGGTLIR